MSKKSKPDKKNAKLTKKEKQELADGAKNEKWQDEKYAAHMKKQAAKQKAKDKPAEKKAKLTRKEKQELADGLTHDLLEKASLDAHTLKLKPNTNRTQIRHDLTKLQYVLEYESVRGIYPKIRQLTCDIEYMQDQADKSKQKIAENILMPLLCSTLEKFFMTGGKIDTEKL